MKGGLKMVYRWFADAEDGKKFRRAGEEVIIYVNKRNIKIPIFLSDKPAHPFLHN
jgi:hypothetical protein